jgi:hypothetical protein
MQCQLYVELRAFTLPFLLHTPATCIVRILSIHCNLRTRSLKKWQENCWDWQLRADQEGERKRGGHIIESGTEWWRRPSVFFFRSIQPQSFGELFTRNVADSRTHLCFFFLIHGW